MAVVMEDPQPRREERSRLVQAAKLRLPGRGEAWTCMIRDISSNGARMRLPLGFEPEGKVLITAATIGTDRSARVVWRNATSIGVAFE
ncbi:PilZ domain-containing protein [Bosea sp. RAF48]|uniref:PilZ domain-containing protein n=1 Tax=Bosea sp. RAF48 TaxID=3237480 RepID=UPI003F912D79